MFSSIYSLVSKLLWTEPSSTIADDVSVTTSDSDTQEYELSFLLDRLINVGGAGAWPPRNAFGDAWPEALRPYHYIYMEKSSTLCVEHSSLDDEANRRRIEEFRSGMRDALAEIDMDGVIGVLESAEKDYGRDSAITPESYNGFFACMVYLRHAYRWGIMPAVKVAQEDKLIEFPPQLSKPWSFIQRHFGVRSLAGCTTAIFLCNYDDQGLPVYQATLHMPPLYRETEKRFSDILWKMEKAALPIYRNFVDSIVYFQKGMRRECLDALASTNALLPVPLRIFTDALTESKISYGLWMGYVQGFHAFGAGEMVDGELIEYEGLSGNQATFILIIDAYLGMKAYLSEEDELRSVPVVQRDLLAGLRSYNFPSKVKESGDTEILALLDKTMGQMRAFRKAHLSRIRPYLSADRPERKVMTAGRGVLESEVLPDNSTVVDFLEDVLRKRVQQSVIIN